VASDLDEDVGSRAEAVEAEGSRIAGETQRAIADEAGAEKRRRLFVRVARGDGKAVALVGEGVLGVAAVDLVSREPRALAEVLAVRQAEAARAARPPEPGHADPVGFLE